ncbi:hypothetical protein ACV3RS_16165 [Clostridium perfringens]
MESYIETGNDKDLRLINIESSKFYRYSRVRSKEKNLDRQIELLKDYGVNKRDIIIDKQSGKTLIEKDIRHLRSSY